MSALAHDERCEQRCLVCRYRLDDFWHDPLKTHAYQPDFCGCAERALAAARQREEELKANGDFLRESIGECHLMISRNLTEFQLKQDWDATTLPHRLQRILRERDALRAENDRLTLAASESARTMQVEMRLKDERIWFLGELVGGNRIEVLVKERDALQAQVTALREALTQLRVLPNNIDPPEFCWCGWQADLKNHSYVCQFARRTIAALPQDGA